jgi:ABC-type glycerol-3-phosphate transport system substrate-binding protein
MRARRRTFVKAAVTAGVGAAAALPFPAVLRAQKSTKLRVAYMPFPIQQLWVDAMTEWGKQRGIQIERAPISYENYVKSISAQLLLPQPDVDVLWHNDDWGQLIGPYLESLDDIPGINERVAWKYAPAVAFDIDGHRKTLPFMISSDKFFYRTDLVDKPPASWAEMIDVSKRLMADKKVKWGYVGGWRYLHSWYTLFWALWANLPVGERDNKKLAANGWKAGVEAREHQEMMDLWWDCLHTHKICPPAMINYTRTDAQPVFTSGEAAFYADSNLPWADIKNPAKSKVAGRATFTMHPVGPSAPFKRWTYGAAWGWAIPAKAPKSDREAAKELFTWLLANRTLMRDTWFKGASLPPAQDIWPELVKEDKEFAEMFRGISEGWHYVVPSYYFKTWLEAFSTYADFCTRAVQGSKPDIPKVMKELAPRLTEIGRQSMA